MKFNTTKTVIGGVLVAALVGGGYFLYHTGRLGAQAVDPKKENKKENKKEEAEAAHTPVLFNVGKDWFEKKDTDPGLRLTDETVKGLALETAKVADAVVARPLPPQIGTLNFDNQRMFLIKPRFTGEVAEIMQVEDKDAYPPKKRPIKFGDKVKQGSILAVFWSQTLGVAKAALVDSICSLRLSEDALERQKKVFNEGALSFSLLKTAERQVQSDSLAVLTAERTLRMWKMTDAEIKEIKDEANVIHDTKKPRDASAEAAKWARVEVIVPWFDKAHPEREMTILEKNTNLYDMVDPANYSMPLFRIADMSELQIWAHPQEEYLPLIREGLKHKGKLTWEIRFQSESADKIALLLPMDRVAPSLEPNQHTPMVVGYLPNPEYRYLAGQFVTATLFMPPEPNTVEIPTDALNEIKGQAFIFIKEKQGEYTCRRVSVVRRHKDYCVLRKELTPEDIKISEAEVKAGRWPLRPVQPGEAVVTRAVVEMTTALENLITKEQAKRLVME